MVVPVLSRTFQESRERFRDRANYQIGTQIAVGLVLSVLLFVFAPWIIKLLFTEEYSSSVEILRLLSPLPFFRSVNFALAAVLTSSGRQSDRTKIQITAAVFNVTGNLIVIFPYGIIGVSIIYLLSELLLGLGYLYLLRTRPASTAMSENSLDKDLRAK